MHPDPTHRRTLAPGGEPNWSPDGRGERRRPGIESMPDVPKPQTRCDIADLMPHVGLLSPRTGGGARATPVDSMPATSDWTDYSGHDPGIALVELFAYLADVLSSYEEQIAAEARLKTRRRYVVALGAIVIFALCRRRRPDDVRPG